MNYLTSLIRSQYQGIMRYSGEYNLLLFVLGLIYFDNHLQNRIRRDLTRVLVMHRTFEKIRTDVELKDEQARLQL